jgi:NADPH-dependent 2,4-dienoyl-CoA reductase/sulfur reductase-like enzyme
MPKNAPDVVAEATRIAAEIILAKTNKGALILKCSVGAWAAGRRRDEGAPYRRNVPEIIMFEQWQYFLCQLGLPYYVRDKQDSDDLILVTPELFQIHVQYDVLHRHKETASILSARPLTFPVRTSFNESTTKLILAMGGEPLRPAYRHRPPQVYNVLPYPTLSDRRLPRGGAKSAVVVGGGFIGI